MEPFLILYEFIITLSQPTCQEKKLDKVYFYFDMDFSIVCFHIGVILVIKVNIKPLYGISYNGFLI